MLELDKKIRLSVLLGIRLHPKTSDSLQLRNPGCLLPSDHNNSNHTIND